MARYGLIAAIVLALAGPSAQSQHNREGLFRATVDGCVSVPGDEFTRLQAGYTYNPFGMAGVDYFLPASFGAHGVVFAGLLNNTANDLILKKFYRLQYNAVNYSTVMFGLLAGASFSLPPVLDFRAMLYARAGLMFYSAETSFDELVEKSSGTTFLYGPGVTVEYPVTRTMSLRLSYNGFFTMTDVLDGLSFEGSNRDGFSIFGVGLGWIINPADIIEDESHSPASPVFPVRQPADYIPAPQNPPDQHTRTPRETPPPERRSEGDAAPEIQEEAAVEEGKPAPLTALLSVMDVENFDAFRNEPEAVRLNLENRTGSAFPATVRFEARQDGRLVAGSTRTVTISDRENDLLAPGFLDLSAFEGGKGSGNRLPTGLYDIFVSVQPESGEAATTARTVLTHIDYESIFGGDQERVRYLTHSGQAGVSLPAGGEVLFNTFGRSFPRASTSAAPVNEPVGREAAAIAPLSMTEAQRELYISSMLRESLNKSMLIINSAQKQPTSPERVSSVVAEVYFPRDGAEISDESRIVLNQVAQLLHQHPELNAQIRGYADEAADDAYNMLLSQRRADRVYEHLNRNQIPDTRVRSFGMGRSTTPAQNDQDARRARRVQIVIGGGMR